MRKIAGDEHTCSATWPKQKLVEKYNSSLHITTDGYHSIITLKERVENIINDTWYQERCENVYDEKERIISTAAKLINVEIQELSENSTHKRTESRVKMKMKSGFLRVW